VVCKGTQLLRVHLLPLFLHCCCAVNGIICAVVVCHCHCSLFGDEFTATLVEHSQGWCVAGVTAVPGSANSTAGTQPLVVQLLLLQPRGPENEADYLLLQANQVATAAAAAEVPTPLIMESDATAQLQQQLAAYEAECAALVPKHSVETASQQHPLQESNCHAPAVKEQQQLQAAASLRGGYARG
jgi:hypothetical protein